MNTQEFFNLLKSHQDKALVFEYKPSKYVGANYHITEVKHVHIDAVDCGSGMANWNETIVQLCESPSEKGKTEYMSAYKALAILKKVGKMKPYDLNAEIKFEYSNDNFHMAQLFVNDFDIHGQHLILKLAVEKTDCKAKEVCGIHEAKTTTSLEPCCSPKSGCC